MEEHTFEKDTSQTLEEKVHETLSSLCQDLSLGDISTVTQMINEELEIIKVIKIVELLNKYSKADGTQ